MKKINKFFLMGTVALTGMAGVTSCSSDDSGNDITNNPTLENGVVKTRFALNVPYARGTRMTENNTQGEGKNFLGISNMRLMTFTGKENTITGETPIGSNYDLGSDNQAYDKDPSKRYVYRDVAVPVNTQSFILYGRATRSGNTDDDYFDYGLLNVSNAYTNTSNTSLKNVTFTLKQIQPSVVFSGNSEAQKILEALNSILTSEAEYEGETVKWANIGSSTPERKFLQQRYVSFTKLTSGSAKTVKAAINGLLSQIGNPSADKTLSLEIKKRCEQAISDLETNSFPTDLELPEGSARVKYNDNVETPAFSYVESNASEAGDNTINYNNITYPASLAYFAKTNSMVSTAELTSLSQLPDYDAWIKDAKTAWDNTSFTENKVDATTRSIGLKEPIQYGVANLKLTVRCANGSLKDNASAILGDGTEDATITVNENTFTLKGVLVGGQPSAAGWDFNPSTGATFDRVIYDKKMNVDKNGAFKVPVSQTVPQQCNYTLVLDNNKAEQQDETVYVTLELVNNGGEFYGQNGLIPAGGTFYLVGALKLGEGTDKGTDITHIFTQDHTTIANFSIGSLQKAYNCIPDLRSSQISIGLAVDLTWQKGIQFDVTIE